MFSAPYPTNVLRFFTNTASVMQVMHYAQLIASGGGIYIEVIIIISK